jgi:adenine-specific DNA-methyltransferase
VKRPDHELPDSLRRVRAARREATPAERRLWQVLRARQLDGFKFRRQVWLGSFIADFFCADAKLIVEVDGDSHASQAAYDRHRTEWLEREGFSLVRVTNADVMQNLDGVLAHIASVLPSPSQPAAPAGSLPLP